MVRIRVIERRLPHGWEVLLEINGVIGRAEEMLCLEEMNSPYMPKPKPVSEKVTVLQPWIRHPESFITVTGPPAEFASSLEK
jgi:hypothetical protein